MMAKILLWHRKALLIFTAACLMKGCYSKMFELSSVDEMEALFSHQTPNGPVLTKPLLLGVYADECTEMVNTMAFTGGNRNAPEELLTVAKIKSSLLQSYLKAFGLENHCAALLNFQKGSRIDQFSSFFEVDEKSQTTWLAQMQRFDVIYHNNFPHDVNVFWYEEGKNEHQVNTLGPGENALMGTHLGHLFTVRSQQGQLLTWFVANGPGDIYLDHDPQQHECYEDIDSSITGQACENVEDILYEFAMSLWYNKRQELNAYQPRLVPEMTETGFEKHRLPEETFIWLRDYYTFGKRKKIEEGPVGPCLNQHVSPTYMIHLTPSQKQRLNREIEPMLADWSKRNDLVQTSIYGIREYTNGSVLRMHVDTVNTHVISAIINVAQSPGAVWPLQILDHDGNLHEVPMEPGDIVYYESARLLHGREKPLEGEYYANCFIHYKPQSDWDFDWI
mmetsp:Transcript_17860/g.23532  ORF Transcript_17860/g.23532 Transcript_17860/m.23532 type:complete len:448 (-) Transcript_17860:247-1590(-)